MLRFRCTGPLLSSFYLWTWFFLWPKILDSMSATNMIILFVTLAEFPSVWRCWKQWFQTRKVGARAFFHQEWWLPFSSLSTLDNWRSWTPKIFQKKFLLLLFSSPSRREWSISFSIFLWMFLNLPSRSWSYLDKLRITLINLILTPECCKFFLRSNATGSSLIVITRT